MRVNDVTDPKAVFDGEQCKARAHDAVPVNQSFLEMDVLDLASLIFLEESTVNSR
jgi:hypothetical protein